MPFGIAFTKSGFSLFVIVDAAENNFQSFIDCVKFRANFRHRALSIFFNEREFDFRKRALSRKCTYGRFRMYTRKLMCAFGPRKVGQSGTSERKNIINFFRGKSIEACLCVHTEAADNPLYRRSMAGVIKSVLYIPAFAAFSKIPVFVHERNNFTQVGEKALIIVRNGQT